MPNSELKNKEWPIPDHVKNTLKQNLQDLDPQDPGYKRIKNLLNSGNVSYQNLKRIKNFFDENSNTKLTHELKKWVNKTLEKARRNTYMPKRTQQDIGMPNKHKKTHSKDKNKNPTNVNTARVPRSARNIGRNMATYENNKTIYNKKMGKNKIKLTEKDLRNIVRRVIREQKESNQILDDPERAGITTNIIPEFEKNLKSLYKALKIGEDLEALRIAEEMKNQTEWILKRLKEEDI